MNTLSHGQLMDSVVSIAGIHMLQGSVGAEVFLLHAEIVRRCLPRGVPGHGMAGRVVLSCRALSHLLRLVPYWLSSFPRFVRLTPSARCVDPGLSAACASRGRLSTKCGVSEEAASGDTASTVADWSIGKKGYEFFPQAFVPPKGRPAQSTISATSSSGRYTGSPFAIAS